MTKENETKITSDSKDKTPLITQLVYEKIAVIMKSSSGAMESGDMKRSLYLLELAENILTEYIEMKKICDPEAVRDW